MSRQREPTSLFTDYTRAVAVADPEDRMYARSLATRASPRSTRSSLCRSLVCKSFTTCSEGADAAAVVSSLEGSPCPVTITTGEPVDPACQNE